MTKKMEFGVQKTLKLVLSLKTQSSPELAESHKLEKIQMKSSNSPTMRLAETPGVEKSVLILSTITDPVRPILSNVTLCHTVPSVIFEAVVCNMFKFIAMHFVLVTALARSLFKALISQHTDI